MKLRFQTSRRPWRPHQTGLLSGLKHRSDPPKELLTGGQESIILFGEKGAWVQLELRVETRSIVWGQ